MMLQSETQAPSFRLPGTDGAEITRFSLAEFTETGPTVLAFYPFDFSPVCSAELCRFRDLEWLTVDGDVDVVGISPDSAYAHKQFITEYELNFPLLTDRFGTVAGKYDVLMEEFEHHQAIPKRSVVTIDETGTIRTTWEADSQYQAPSTETIEALTRWYREDAYA